MIGDADRTVVLRAERELATIEILLAAMPLSELARQRLEGAIGAVSNGLEQRRAEVGLPQRTAQGGS
jgi:hypothetical protein